MNKAVNDDRRPDEELDATAPAPTAAPPRPAAPSAFRIYKPGQGAYVRWGSAAGAAVILLGLTAFLREELTRVQNLWVENLVPAAVLVVLAYWVFRLIGQNRSMVDFLVATEGEMKKVNWSTRREVLGATKVVIVTVLALGIILFLVDVFFIVFFERIGVLRIGMLANLFRRGTE